jgi:hypothetical protein
MIATKYRKRILGGQLKRKEAQIEGKCSGGDRWPDPPHYWVIDDLDNQVTYHVLVNERPTWSRYAPKD